MNRGIKKGMLAGMLRRTTALLLACSLTLSFGAFPVSALSTRDAYYISVLKPANIPKSAESYPVKLIINKAPGLPYGQIERLEFTGMCGVNAEITDEEMLGLLQESLPAVKEYKELQDPTDDKALVQELTDKLKVTDKDISDMFDNWKKLWGVDTVADLLSGKLPGIGGSDVVNSLIDGAQGDIPMLPGMPGVGTVIDGVFISYEQWQRDKEKWQDAASIYEANQRLRAFNSRLSSKIREQLVEKGSWGIRISSQDWTDFRFDYSNGNKQIWTADIELTKDDGSYRSIAGSYEGRFELTMDCDLSAYDSNYAKELAELITALSTKDSYLNLPAVTLIQNVALGEVIIGNSRWTPVSSTGEPTELLCRFEIPDCVLNLSLPAGANRAFFEIPIPADYVFMTEYSRQANRTVVLSGTSPRWSHSLTLNFTMDDDVTSAASDRVSWTGGESSSSHKEDSWSEVYDYSASLDMTLIIDMLGS